MKATPKQNPIGGIYAGAELKPYAGRPGSMRAFDLPSLSNGRREPRKAPVSFGGTKK
jgi:hypothetical protein